MNMKETVLHFSRSKKFYVPLVITLLMCFAYTITHPSVSIDDTAFSIYFDQLGGLSQGRLLPILLSKILPIFHFAPVILELSAVLLMALSTILWASLFKNASNDKLHPAFYTFFACLMVSYPLICNIFIYMTAVFNIGLGFALIPLSLYYAFKYIDSRHCKYGVYAALLLYAAESLYESFGSVYLIGIFMLLFLSSWHHQEKPQHRSKKQEKAQKKHTAWLLIVPLIVATILDLLTSFIFSRPGIIQLFGITDVSKFAKKSILWTSKGFGETIHTFFSTVWQNDFMTGLISVPIAVFVIACILWLFTIVMLAEKKSNGRLIGIGLLVFISIFALSFLQGTAAPYRTCQVMAVFVAFALAVVLHCTIEAHYAKTVKTIFAALLILLLVYQVNDTNRLFYIDNLRYQETRDKVVTIGYQLESQFDIAHKPVVFVGTPLDPDNITKALSFDPNTIRGKMYMKDRKLYAPDTSAQGELASDFFSWSVTAFDSEGLGPNSQLLQFFEMNGFTLKPGTQAMYQQAQSLAASKPVWPKQGAIFDAGDFIIVHF